MRSRIFVALLTVALLVLLPVLATNAQVKEPMEWVIAKRLTVNTQATIGTDLAVGDDVAITGDLTAATASFTTLTAPTVTMTSATTWTVASLTATTAVIGDLGLTTGTSDAFTATALVGGATQLTSLDVSGNGDVTGNLEVVDHLLTQAELYLIPPATQTITNGGTITGNGGIVEVTAAGAVTATLATAGDGQVLILVNVGAQVINIVDAGTTKLAGALALGPDDTVMLVGVGVSWYMVSTSAN